MGTRADFYVADADGENLEWLGSIAWDGYAIDHVALASTAEGFRLALSEFFAGRDDVTLPERGWPWPWNTSDTTDYGYVLIEGKGVFYRRGNGEVFSAADDGDEPVKGVSFAAYPDMSDRKNVRMDRGYGLLVFGAS